MTASDDMEVLLEHEEPLKPTSIRRRTLAFAAIALALAGAAAVSLRKPSQALPSQAYSVTGLSEDEGCFKKGMFYDGPEKLDGTEKTVEESPQKCQARCETEDRCVHFTFWPDGGCSLTGNASHIKAATDELSNTTVGPKSCKDVATLSASSPAATNTTAKTAAATPTTATTQVPLSETKSNFAPIVKKAASMVQYVVMPDVIKISQDIMRGHFQFSTLQAPDEFLPDKATLANMSTAQLTARKEYWMTFMASEFAATVGIGSAIMVAVPPVRQWMLPKTQYDPVDTARSEAFQTNIQRTIVASSFGTTFIAATAFVMYSVEHDSLSKLFGLDFEFYAALETLGCNWLLAQAVWATCTCQPADRYEATIFLEASVFGVAPVLSDPYDTTKDIMFAGLCLRSTSKLLNAFGVLSLIWLLIVHVWFFTYDDLVSEMAATYASVKYARKKHKDDTPKWMKILLAMFSQTTKGKVKVLLGETCVQGVGAILYVIIEGGSPLVTTLNLVIPVLQLIFALVARE